jgi:TRAP-type C4-dicarboxylate transport system permease small subunit
MADRKPEAAPLVFLDRACVALGSLSGVLILVMILLVSVDVVIRKLFAETVPGASEINTLLLVALVYLGLAGAQARGAHFSVTLLRDRLPAGGRRATDMATTAVSLAFTGVLTVFTYGKAMQSFASGEASFGVVAFPIWPSRAAIALGFALLSLQLLVQLLRLALGRDAKPLQDLEGAP